MLKHRWLLSVLVLTCLVPTLGLTNEPEPPFEHVSRAAVEILNNGRLLGSGWVASPDGLIITAAHVVGGNGAIEVLRQDQSPVPAQLLALDFGHDLALLKLSRRSGFLPYLELTSVPSKLSEPLNLFGSPLKRHGLLLPGHLAKAEQVFEWNELNRSYTSVYPLAAMTPEGLSGGPWTNVVGKVVGVQTGMMSRESALMGVAFMAPAPAVTSLLQSRKNAATIWLGCTLAERWEVSPKANVPGITVIRTISGSPAQQAGLQGGDLITHAGGQVIVYRDQLLRLIRAQPEGGELSLQVLRKGRQLSLQLPLQPREKY